LTILVISRDVAIVLTVAIINLAVGPRTFKPSALGKVATVVYVLTCSVTLTFNYLDRHSTVVDLCVYAALAITLVSGLHYIVLVRRVIAES
jgi:cardiolipin synthase